MPAQDRLRLHDPNNAKQWITGLSFGYVLDSPKEHHTGQASGRRQHQPVRVVTHWGPWTPQVFAAAVQNEELTEINFEFRNTGATGKEETYYTITLKNGRVTHVGFNHDDFSYGAAKEISGVAAKPELMEFMLIFAEITMENKDGKTTAQDQWIGGS